MLARILSLLRLTAISFVSIAGCASFVQPSDEVREFVRKLPSPEGPSIRARIRVNAESSWLSGSFEGVLAADTGDRPRVRMQLFPDVGPKVFDLVAEPDRVAGYFQQRNESADHPLPHVGEATAIYCLGITLLEHFGRLREDRLAGMIEGPDDWRLLLAPSWGEKRTVVSLGRDGGVRGREFEHIDGIRWWQECSRDGAFSIHTRGVRLELAVVEYRRVERLPDSVFDLKIPSGMSPSKRSTGR